MLFLRVGLHPLACNMSFWQAANLYRLVTIWTKTKKESEKLNIRKFTDTKI